MGGGIWEHASRACSLAGGTVRAGGHKSCARQGADERAVCFAARPARRRGSRCASGPPPPAAPPRPAPAPPSPRRSLQAPARRRAPARRIEQVPACRRETRRPPPARIPPVRSESCSVGRRARGAARGIAGSAAERLPALRHRRNRRHAGAAASHRGPAVIRPLRAWANGCCGSRGRTCLRSCWASCKYDAALAVSGWPSPSAALKMARALLWRSMVRPCWP